MPPCTFRSESSRGNLFIKFVLLDPLNGSTGSLSFHLSSSSGGARGLQHLHAAADAHAGGRLGGVAHRHEERQHRLREGVGNISGKKPRIEMVCLLHSGGIFVGSVKFLKII